MEGGEHAEQYTCTVYLAVLQKLFRHFIDISSGERSTFAERKRKRGNHPEKREQFFSSSVADDTRAPSLCCGRREAIKRLDRRRLRREMSAEMWVLPPPTPLPSSSCLRLLSGERKWGEGEGLPFYFLDAPTFDGTDGKGTYVIFLNLGGR